MMPFPVRHPRANEAAIEEGFFAAGLRSAFLAHAMPTHNIASVPTGGRRKFIAADRGPAGEKAISQNNFH